MGHYKGKREAQHSDNIKQGQPADPVKQEQPVSMGDPFQEDRRSIGEWLEDFFDDTAWFFRSPKGKILSAVFCGLIVLGIFGYVGARQWIKPPELPGSGTQQNGGSTTISPNKPSNSNQGEGSAAVQPGQDEDELYPDDGYGGDMPELSGARKEGVYTFLLVGTDKGDGNTDTIMVASYDTVKQTVNVMSIPRDTMINESWDIKKINSVYSRTGSSIDALSNRVKKLIGFKPDFYVKVDLSMFVELVDLVGGV
ncbi:MAG: LCP family protein, partial [Oscillospiraceae bacterium]|nr:LCP family protein [Oscillospiraceae bacterium]